jgi:hypothetical protein
VIKPSQQSLPSVAFMLAKPSNIAEGARVTKTILIEKMSDETAWTKRTQGICQPAGSVARSQKLIQPRKRLDVEDDLVTSRGSQHRYLAQWRAGVGFHRGPRRLWDGRREATKSPSRSERRGAGDLELGRPVRRACWETSRSLMLNATSAKRSVDARRSQTRSYYSATVTPITWGRDGRFGNASKALTTRKECPQYWCHAPCLQIATGIATLCGTPGAVRAKLRSLVRENRTQGSVRGAPGNRRPYLDRAVILSYCQN